MQIALNEIFYIVCTLYNYIRENKFRAFYTHENIFTMKEANYGTDIRMALW